MTNAPYRVGLVGLGTIAPYFLDAIAGAGDSWQLTAVCDVAPEKLAGYRGTDVACFTSIDELLASGLVDAVVVTLPNHLHASAIRSAIKYGVHVCCEKPLTIDAAEARELAASAVSSGVAVFTASHRRHNHHVQQLAANFPDRSQVARVTSRYFENIEEHVGGDDWYLDLARCGGGCVIDNGPNAIDAVRVVLGELSVVDCTLGDLRAGVEFSAEIDLVATDGTPVTVLLDWAYPDGQVKDLTVELTDGQILSVDMLAGYDGLKGSLEHEYAGIMANFADLLTGPAEVAIRDGVAVVELIAAAYRAGRRNERRLNMPSKAPTIGSLAKLWFHSRDDRGMILAPWGSRCLAAGELHELVVTDQLDGAAGDRIDRVGFLGHLEIATGGVVEKGDRVFLGKEPLGTVLGFDESHFPNHYNILIAADRLVTADLAGAALGDEVSFIENTPRATWQSWRTNDDH